MAVWSIIKKSETEGSSRIDAEYYQPKYLQSELKIKNIKHDQLGNLISLLTDYHANGSYEILRNNIKLLDKPDYALMIRTVDFEKDNFENDVKYVSKHAYDFLKKTQLFGYEIIINKIGNPGKVYIVPPLNRKITLGMNQFMIRPKKNINCKYLYVFLISSLGNQLLQRKITGAVPLSIDKKSVRSVMIPILDNNFQLYIDMLVEKHLRLRAESKSLYSQAEQILLEELGLKDLDLKDDLFYTTTLKEAKEINRMDAEYYMPKYEIIEQKLKSFKQVRLEEISSLINYGTVPTSPYIEKGVPYIKGLNLVDCFVDDIKLDYLDFDSTKKLHQKFYVKENDIIISQMGTVGKASIVGKEQDSWLFASFTIRVRLKKNCDINSFYLTFFIEKISRPFYLLRKIAHASVRQNTDLPTIKNLPVVLISNSKQNLIADKLINSHLLKLKAKSLLEEAKHKVEEMIEKEAVLNNGI